ncbi:MAG TPA: hypothetical protein VHP99_00270 [Pyrinomonadaceae bacterium]|jgi:uncharacterized membrane protein|nr:hypothetical protein [Pyrinomonadaceae bacterium]
MEPKRSKYDTNPLDENVAHRADESFGRNGSGAATEDFSGPTSPINPETSRVVQDTEAPTRRMDEKVTGYPSVFVPPPRRVSTTYEPPRIAPADIYQPPPGSPPNIYQPAGGLLFSKPGLHHVQGLGIPERWAAILPYMPFSSWLGIVVAVVELFLTPRTETRVRFHASQALVLQIAISALTTLLTFIGLIFRNNFSGASLLRLAGFIFLVVAVVKVWKGKPFVVTAVEEPRRWFDEKIKPRK